MALVKTPLYGTEARGRLGKSLVYSKYKNRNYVKSLVAPGNPKTPGQLLQRARYVGCRACYRAAELNDVDKRMYKLYMKDDSHGGTVYNGLMSFCLREKVEVGEWSSPREVLIAKLLGMQVFFRVKWDFNWAPVLALYNKNRKFLDAGYLAADGEYWSNTFFWCIPGVKYYFRVYDYPRFQTWFYEWVHPT